MHYQELVILLPCHSLEDFPLHHRRDKAAGLLACWTALWHPALLAAAQRLPQWYRADSPPERLAERLVVVPEVSRLELPAGFAERADEEGACLIVGKTQTREILDTALARLEDAAAVPAPALVDEFLAVGYCYLEVELLTRQMRYSSNLDQVHFQKQIIAGAQAAVQGEADEARRRLTACLDVLAQERDHYYPVDAFILDLALVGPTTLAADLRSQLRSTTPLNVLIGGELVDQLEREHPQSLEALREAVQQGRVTIVGGEYREHRLPLLSCETVLREFERGLASYTRLLDQRPRIFGRRRFGLTPLLPQLLQKLGFQAALHLGLEGGQLPEGSQIKIRWEGSDGSALDAIARTPLEGQRPENYLSYALKMGESMEMDHVATVCLAHWPDRASPWLQLLQTIARYSGVLGKFVTAEQYFRESDFPAHLDRFEADQYRSPYLKQVVNRNLADPLSSSVRYWQSCVTAEAEQTFRVLRALVSGQPAEHDRQRLYQVDDASEQVDVSEAWRQGLRSAAEQAAQQLAEILPRQSRSAQSGYLCFNPYSFATRVGLDVSRLPALPQVERPIYAAATTSTGMQVVVDIPPLGFAWISGNESGAEPPRDVPPLAEEGLLRNEFFEAVINPTTGTLQSIHQYQARRNRLSQQLAYRFDIHERSPAAEESDETAYTVMAADRVEVTQATDCLGQITTVGKLLSRQGQLIADFKQVYELWRGSRVLVIDIELEPHRQPHGDPWTCYYACRFAWPDESADVYRSVHQTRHRVASSKRLDAPLFVELVAGSERTTILTGGLPFHRRRQFRMLDTLLIAHGERARRFRLGIGIDVKQPLQEALKLLAPPFALYQQAAPPAPVASAWLFHIDARNVVATWWEPLVVEQRVVGFQVRLLETSGRAARTRLSCFRPVTEARQTDFQGATLAHCTTEQGQVRLELAAYEWTQVEAYFEKGIGD